MSGGSVMYVACMEVAVAAAMAMAAEEARVMVLLLVLLLVMVWASLVGALAETAVLASAADAEV